MPKSHRPYAPEFRQRVIELVRKGRTPEELARQYTSIAFGLRCREAGVQPLMGSVGDAYDNALCESFFATLECELLDRHRFGTHAAAHLAVFEYLEGWYNPRRRHSALDYLSPIAYEQRELGRR
jgi:putative transposase